MVEVTHLVTRDGDKLTDAFYELDGQPAYSRLLGHLTSFEAETVLATMRMRAKRVVYVQH